MRNMQVYNIIDLSEPVYLFSVAALDGMAAFSDRPTVFEFKRRGNCFNSIYLKIFSHVAGTCYHDRTAHALPTSGFNTICLNSHRLTGQKSSFVLLSV